MINKQETIDAIVKLNPSATRDFLESFGDDELSRYLNRLNDRAKYSREEMGWRRSTMLSATKRTVAGVGGASY